jgi:hypothetical protein
MDGAKVNQPSSAQKIAALSSNLDFYLKKIVFMQIFFANYPTLGRARDASSHLGH